MMRFDMHMHTDRHSMCSCTKPLALVAAAVAAGLDGVVVTDHDYLWPDDELAELRAAAPGLVILAGMEVTARGGDVLVYGVTDPSRVPKGIDWPDLCREVHRQGGACVLAHPYRWGQPVDDLFAEKRPEFDGLELMSKNMDADLRSRAAALHARHPHLAGLANSDSHEPDTVGLCYTEFDADIRTSRDLVAAIRDRKLRAVAGPRDRGGRVESEA